MSAGVSEKLCSMTDLAEMVDATAKPGKRGPYKKTAPENSNWDTTQPGSGSV
jgi:hypothetical protein